MSIGRADLAGFFRESIERNRRKTPEEKRADRALWIDRMEKETELVFQGIGKWPEQRLDERIDGLYRDAGYLLNADLAGLPKLETRESRLQLISYLLLQYREQLDISNPLHTQIEKITNNVKVDTKDGNLMVNYWVLLAAGVWCAMIAAVYFDHYWVYRLSRWLICPAAGYGAILGAVVATRFWKVMLWPMWALVVVFNPLVPLHFGRDSWQIVDGIAAAVFLTGFGYEYLRRNVHR